MMGKQTYAERTRQVIRLLLKDRPPAHRQLARAQARIVVVSAISRARTHRRVPPLRPQQLKTKREFHISCTPIRRAGLRDLAVESGTKERARILFWGRAALQD